jgi:TRAP-type C4-dicarboxylate transport system substrate-binding protein
MDRRSISAITLLALGVTLGGCGGGVPPAVADKAGSQTLVLHVATNDGTHQQDLPPGPKEFVDGLEAVSGGRIQVDYSLNYQGNLADSETKLVQAMVSGDLDAAFPSVRAFANAGIRGLEAVEAPMTLTNYAAVKELVSGSAGADILAQLHGTGVVGLGLAVGPLRRPFAAKGPLLAPEDWRGMPFRSFNSPVQDATIRALGGNPVEAADWIDDLASGQLRGAEFDIRQYAANGYTTEAPYVTANVVLWPKVFVLSLSQKRWDAMTDQQRTWVQEAATAGAKAATDDFYNETPVANTLCDAGVSFVNASASQLAALHAAVAPVIGSLASDPVTSALLAKVQAIAALHSGTDVPNVPARCTVAAAPSAAPSIPTATSMLPAGTYRVQVTLADVTKAGVSNGSGITGTWTLTVKDGTYVVSCQAVAEPGVDCGNIEANTAVPVQAGLLRGTGQTVYFVPDAQQAAKAQGCLPSACQVDAPYWVDWALNGTTLTFTNRGGIARDVDSLSIRPWLKIR